jgi:hypothetical protein
MTLKISNSGLDGTTDWINGDAEVYACTDYPDRNADTGPIVPVPTGDDGDFGERSHNAHDGMMSVSLPPVTNINNHVAQTTGTSSNSLTGTVYKSIIFQNTDTDKGIYYRLLYSSGPRLIKYVYKEEWIWDEWDQDWYLSYGWYGEGYFNMLMPAWQSSDVQDALAMYTEDDNIFGFVVGRNLSGGIIRHYLYNRSTDTLTYTTLKSATINGHFSYVTNGRKIVFETSDSTNPYSYEIHIVDVLTGAITSTSTWSAPAETLYAKINASDLFLVGNHAVSMKAWITGQGDTSPGCKEYVTGVRYGYTDVNLDTNTISRDELGGYNRTCELDVDAMYQGAEVRWNEVNQIYHISGTEMQPTFFMMTDRNYEQGTGVLRCYLAYKRVRWKWTGYNLIGTPYWNVYDYVWEISETYWDVPSFTQIGEGGMYSYNAGSESRDNLITTLHHPELTNFPDYAGGQDWDHRYRLAASDYHGAIIVDSCANAHLSSGYMVGDFIFRDRFFNVVASHLEEPARNGNYIEDHQTNPVVWVNASYYPQATNNGCILDVASRKDDIDGAIYLLIGRYSGSSYSAFLVGYNPDGTIMKRFYYPYTYQVWDDYSGTFISVTTLREDIVASSHPNYYLTLQDFLVFGNIFSYQYRNTSGTYYYRAWRYVGYEQPPGSRLIPGLCVRYSDVHGSEDWFDGDVEIYDCTDYHASDSGLCVRYSDVYGTTDWFDGDVAVYSVKETDQEAE